MAKLLRQRIDTIKQEEATIRASNNKLAEEIQDAKDEVDRKQRAPVSKKR